MLTGGANGSAFEIPFTKGADKVTEHEKEDKTFYHYINRNIELSVKPAVVQATEQIAVEYSFDYNIWSPLTGKGNLRLNFESTGDISTKPEISRLQSNIYGGGNISFLYNLALPYTSGRKYPMGFAAKPGVESDQKAKLVNFVPSADIVVSIPYIDNLFLFIQRITNANRPFYPAVTTWGYTVVENIEKPDSLIRSTENRIDGDVLFNFPLSSRIDINFKWQYHYFVKSEDSVNWYQFAGVYFFSEDRDAGVRFSYQNGSIAPEFIREDSVRLGLHINLI